MESTVVYVNKKQTPNNLFNFYLTIKPQESIREKMPWRGSSCTVSVILYLPFSEELLHLEMVDLAGGK